MTRLLLAFALAVLATPAFAQAAVPIGFWTTPDGGERLLIEQNTSCSFYAVGGSQFGGNCVWQSSSNGGILALYYETIKGLAPVYWSVIWVNQGEITVNGDPFFRRQ